MPDENEALSEATKRSAFRAFYMGAFVALGVRNTAVVVELVELTRDLEEAVEAIGVMRQAREGDRVYRALAWLRAQAVARASSLPGAFRGPPEDVSKRCRTCGASPRTHACDEEACEPRS